MVIVANTVFMSCSKSEKESENPYKSEIIGVWELTHFNGSSVNSLPSIFYKQTTITFGHNGIYSGKGIFGDGDGKYVLTDNIVKTYIDGDLYHTYEIISLNNNQIEAKMTDESGVATIKGKKIQ